MCGKILYVNSEDMTTEVMYLKNEEELLEMIKDSVEEGSGEDDPIISEESGTYGSDKFMGHHLGIVLSKIEDDGHVSKEIED